VAFASRLSEFHDVASSPGMVDEGWKMDPNGGYSRVAYHGLDLVFHCWD
jgi:hypothetical protein